MADEPPTMPPAPPPAQSGAPGAPAGEDRTLAAVAYILTIVTGLLVYLIAKPEDKYARWHAIQAIGLGVGAIVVSVVLSIVGTILAFGTALSGGGPAGLFGLGVLSGLWTLVVVILVLVLAVKAYQGEKVRLPVIAEIADRNA